MENIVVTVSFWLHLVGKMIITLTPTVHIHRKKRIILLIYIYL